MVAKLTSEWVAKRLPKRPNNANKGTFGKVLIIAGSENYPGAAFLSCAASYRTGAGLVTLAAKQIVKIIVSKKLPEVTFLSFEEAITKAGEYDALLLGPGLGQEKQAIDLIEKLLTKNLPKTVIDADALNIFSKMGDWWKGLKGENILTPHPGEMSRLTGLTIKEIQSDRVNVAQYWADKWNQVVVLKGANTVIASPTGRVTISPFVNPILATAGTGDILTGIISGLLAQGLNPYEASCVGVYIHGLAGEELAGELGNTGALASDLLPLLPQIIKKLA